MDNPNRSYALQEVRVNFDKLTLALGLAQNAAKVAEEKAQNEIREIGGDLASDSAKMYVRESGDKARREKYAEASALLQISNPSRLCWYLDHAKEKHSSDGRLQFGYFEEGLIFELELVNWVYLEFSKILSLP